MKARKNGGGMEEEWRRKGGGQEEEGWRKDGERMGRRKRVGRI